MMKRDAIERQSTEYLRRLEKWQLARWKRRLELLNETYDDLWVIREVLKEREHDKISLVGTVQVYNVKDKGKSIFSKFL